MQQNQKSMQEYKVGDKVIVKAGWFHFFEDQSTVKIVRITKWTHLGFMYECVGLTNTGKLSQILEISDIISLAPQTSASCTTPSEKN